MSSHFKAIQDDLVDAMDGAAFICAQDQMEGREDAYSRQQFGRLMGLVQAYHIMCGNEIDHCRLSDYANIAIEGQLVLIGAAG
jgi:hypothetical protein